MTTLDVYVDDADLATLKEAAGDLGATVTWCAEAAVSEAASRWRAEHPKPPSENKEHKSDD